jgi:hypothetical protein
MKTAPTDDGNHIPKKRAKLMNTTKTFQDFLNDLRAFESGWDRDRYDSGRITDAQLTQWAGGTVQSVFPKYSSWGDLTDSEWKEMSYASTNSLGFVGYQFGEALLIDLGYYDDDVFFGNGAAANTWDGNWTGKNGVNSFEEFKTEAAQEVAIREAFGHNLKIIERGLARQGESLSDYVGTTRSYVENGETKTIELTLTGIMAAAHLRGAFGTLNLLQNGSVSADEFGTSILRYIDQFGGYQAPSVADAIAYFEDRITGDEGVGDPTSPAPGGSGGDTPNTGSSGGNVAADKATHVIDWAWGKTEIDTDFDPATDTIYIGWISAVQLEITETSAGVEFLVPSNNQTLTLAGVKLEQLDMARIRTLDDTARAELAGLISDSSGTGNNDGLGDGHSDEGEGHNHGGMNGVMTTITVSSGNQTIGNFNPAQDMVHIEAGITANRLQIFEESGDALGLTTRIVVLDASGNPQSTTILQGVGLSDLGMANFSVADQSAQNEIATAVNSVITTPTNTAGYTVIYDNDGSNPAATTGATESGGVKYRADINGDDIVGFNVSRDQIDVGGTSVHGMIISKTPNGELAIDSPWSNAMQIVTGVQIKDLNIGNFGIVGNEHFRQDLGGVMSWELGVGPRDADTVYVRSHEYGKNEVISDFDPNTMKISFLYFGTRERLTVEDTDAGLKIASLPSGQSLTLTGVSKADLVPGRIEFHHDQVIEDNLETPFGFTSEQVSLVSRAPLLTPAAPAGTSTDGLQVRPGDFSGTTNSDNTPDTSTDGNAGSSGSDGGTNVPDGSVTPTESGLAGYDSFAFKDGVANTAEITWAWGKKTAISNFDIKQDKIDLNALLSEQVNVREADGNLYFEVANNGANSTALVGLQAEDLSLSNLTADGWNSVLTPSSQLMDQLVELGFELG